MHQRSAMNSPVTSAEQAAVDEIIEKMGGWDLVREKMGKLDETSKRFFREYDLLVQQYPYKVVAVGVNGVLEVGDSVESVCSACEDRGLHKLDYWVQYLDPTPRVAIL